MHSSAIRRILAYSMNEARQYSAKIQPGLPQFECLQHRDGGTLPHAPGRAHGPAALGDPGKRAVQRMKEGRDQAREQHATATADLESARPRVAELAAQLLCELVPREAG